MKENPRTPDASGALAGHQGYVADAVGGIGGRER